MRNKPYRTGPSRSATRRRVGCVPLVIVLGVIIGFVVSTWGRLGELLNVEQTRQTEGGLRAAQRAFERGDLDVTIELARQVWNENPENSDALVLMVRALIYRSYSDYNRELDRSLALNVTTDALPYNPHNPDILAIHALALQVNRDPFKAAQFANRALALDVNNALARVALALSYGGVGGHENALRESQAALQLSIGSTYEIDAQRAMAISLGDLGRYQEAMRALDAASKLNNRLPLLNFEQALYAILDGDTDAATAAYFRVLAFDPDNVKARLRMCELSSLLRESETAIKYCTEVTQLAPGWVDGWYHLGREYYLRGSFNEAAQTLARCSTLSVAQDIPIEQRQLQCWYLQGQAAEILHDCDTLRRVYSEFQEMVNSADLPQTWTYPPEGPPICAPT